MTGDELMAEAGRLAMESVLNHWGGPFGAVIARRGDVVATGQNRVLLTGDPTAHAEMEAIRKAVQVLTPCSPTIAPGHLDDATLALATAGESVPGAPRRARMLSGMEIYSTGQPCPMCMAAIYWARLDACYFACGAESARRIGFDDVFISEELRKPPGLRRLKTVNLPSRSCERAYEMWMEDPGRQAY